MQLTNEDNFLHNTLRMVFYCHRSDVSRPLYVHLRERGRGNVRLETYNNNANQNKKKLSRGRERAVDCGAAGAGQARLTLSSLDAGS